MQDDQIKLGKLDNRLLKEKEGKKLEERMKGKKGRTLFILFEKDGPKLE